MQPSACPNSCTTTRSYSVSAVSSVSQPKFIVGSCFGKYDSTNASVPTADHDPCPEAKAILTCSFVSTKSGGIFVFFSQFLVFFFPRFFCTGDPSRNRHFKVEPVSH